MTTLAYRFDSATPPAPRPLAAEYSEELWRPRAPRLFPSGLPRFAPHTLMHYLGLFSNREYGLYLIRANGAIVHHSCITPRDFRFPFMSANDLQIGVVETSEAHRGRGLAAHAIVSIVARLAAPGRAFWYIVHADNHPSIRAVEKAGFSLAGTVEKHARLGLSLLGSYALERAS